MAGQDLVGRDGQHSDCSGLDDTAKRQLIPRFAQVVADLVTRGWIDLNESCDDRAAGQERIGG